MYFISIATLTEAKEFTEWMSGKRKTLSFDDSVSFQEWIENHNIFPLEFYLDGLTYRFKDRRQLLFFACGFEAAFNLRFENER